MLKQTIVIGAILSSAVAFAADLPSKRAEPANYVKVCDAYGAGFFYVPGSDTCLRVGGLVRADTYYVPQQDQYKVTNGAKAISVPAAGENTIGWETRAKIELDARTQTEYGTVQIYMAPRFSRAGGALVDVAQPASSGTQTAGGSTLTLESMYIRFAGLTAGVARDNFAFMPPTYGSNQHWASFVVQPKQLSYTAILGGGIAVTAAIQDPADTANAPVNGMGTTVEYQPATAKNLQYNGRIDYERSWGALALMGAVRNANAVDATTNVYNQTKTVYALGTGVKLNLGEFDTLWMTGAYADGMTEYTGQIGSYKSSTYKRDIGGYQLNPPSFVYFADGIKTVKSWNVGANYEHWWAPTWRSNLFGSYASFKAPDESAAKVWDGISGFGNSKVASVGTTLAWVPTKNFEIGVEGIYANLKQDVRYTLASSTNIVNNESSNNWSARLRLERRF